MRKTFISSAIALALAASTAGAAVSFSYVADAVPAGAPSATGSVNVYLRETVTGGDPSILAAENGLFGAGVRIAQTGTPPAQDAALTGFAAGSGFAGGPSSFSVTADVVQGSEGISNSSSGTGSEDLGGGVRRVLLGTLSFTYGAAAGTSDFSLGGFQANTLTATNGFSIDEGQTSAPAFAPATGSSIAITTVVPEPATLAALGGAAVVALRRRRRAD